MMKTYKAVIFDLDGTLIDSMGIWGEVDKEFLTKRGIKVPVDLFDDMQTGNSYQEMAVYFKKRFSLPDSTTEIMQEWTDLVTEHYHKTIQLKEGVLEILQLLRSKDIPMGIGTSNTLELAKAVLRLHGIEEFFSAIVAGCSDIKGKPNPDIFLRVAEEIDIDCEACVVIEDTFVGVCAAKNAKMNVIAIYDKYSSHEWDNIKRETPYHYTDYKDIQKHLLQHLS